MKSTKKIDCPTCGAKESIVIKGQVTTQYSSMFIKKCHECKNHHTIDEEKHCLVKIECNEE